MLDTPVALALALLHVTWPHAVLLDRSRSAPSPFPGIPLSRPASHMSPASTKQFFGAGCPTSLFDFAGSEHGLRDGSGIPHPDTRQRTVAHADSTFYYF